MLTFYTLYSDFGALTVTLAELQIVQDKLLALIFDGSLYGIFRIIYVFHLISFGQLHAADTDSTLLLLRNLFQRKYNLRQEQSI